MHKSIFDIEARVDIDYEFKNLKRILFEQRAILYCEKRYSLYDFLNQEVFPMWKYKGMFVDLDDFIGRLNIDLNSDTCSEIHFLYLLELLVNLWPVATKIIDYDYREYFSKKVFGYMKMNLPLIIEKMNYKTIKVNDKYKIVKRDSDVDSILDIVSKDCSKLLLDYNDIRNNTLGGKRSILKALDLYIEKNKKLYQNLDKDTYNSIQVIVNKMGVNHPLKDEPYVSFDEEKLVEWYDKCFKLIIHLIRKREVNEINNNRKQISSCLENDVC